jgi:hypothetical protein
MKSHFYVLLLSFFALAVSASAREVALPAGTLLQCTLNEPNFSSATAEVGDPVLCHLRGVTEFGQEAFPRGSYLVGHLESAKDPGHFFGKGSMKLQFDRIGLPSGDLPLDAKVISTRGYHVDKEGKIDGKGHATRDVVEWMLPPLWPWKIITLPARGPRPKLKGETAFTLRLMDDVVIPQVANNSGGGWHSFNNPQNQSYHGAIDSDQQNSLARKSGTSVNFSATLALRGAASQPSAEEIPQAEYASYVSAGAKITRGPANPQIAADISNAAASAPGMPIFVLRTGTVLAVSNYGYRNDRITYSLAGGGGGVISADEVDWTTTTRVNADRGVRVTLHSGHSAPDAPGL